LFVEYIAGILKVKNIFDKKSAYLLILKVSFVPFINPPLAFPSDVKVICSMEKFVCLLCTYL
jgi:hypothetical protein